MKSTGREEQALRFGYAACLPASELAPGLSFIMDRERIEQNAGAFPVERVMILQ